MGFGEGLLVAADLEVGLVVGLAVLAVDFLVAGEAALVVDLVTLVVDLVIGFLVRALEALVG